MLPKPHRGAALLCGAVLSMLVVMACGAPTSPSVAAPVRTLAFTELPQYALWWELTKSCSGLTRDVSQVRWFSNPDSSIRTGADGVRGVAGAWSPTTNSIELVATYVNNAKVVRHEMLHALLAVSGHPREQFTNACAGFVVCTDECALGIVERPLADSSAPRVSLADFTVSQEVLPSTINLAKDPRGWFTLVIDVRNPLPYAVWLKLTPQPGRPDVAGTFAYILGGTSQGSYISGDSISFGGGETKRMVYDLEASSLPSAYQSVRIRGVFNGDTLAEQRIDITR